MENTGRAAVGVGIVFWSIGNLIVRDSTLAGPRLALWRYIVAAIIYVAFYRIAVGRLKLSEFLIAAPAAIALTVEIAIFFTALQRTTIANVTVIGSMTPLILIYVAVNEFGERVTPRIIGATAAGIAGVAVVVYGSSSALRWSASGDLLAVLALIFFAAYFVLAKRARAEISTLALQTYTLMIGIPLLLVMSLFVEGSAYPPEGGEWLHPLLLVAIPTTGHLLVNWAHKHVTLTFVSLMTLAVPVLTSLAAWWIFSESLNGLQLFGVSLTLMVLVFVVMEGQRGSFRAAD